MNLTVSELPVGFCPDTYQAMLNGFANALSLVLPSSFSGITASQTKPSDTSQAWLSLDGLGRPIRLYFFGQGNWLALHPMVPGATIMWINTLPDFTTFDGGDTNALTLTSGPMWQVAVDLASTPITAKFPLSVGTLPSGAAVAVGGTGGEESHVLSTAELPAHSHGLPINQVNFASPGAGANPMAFFGGGGAFSTSNAGSGLGHNTMPPYIGVYFLQRTTRLYYVG